MSLYFQFITLLNFFSNIYIIFLLFIFRYLEIVSEGFVILSLITIFTQGFGSTQFTGTFVSADGNTGTAYFPNSHGNTGGVTQISTNGGTVNDYILYEYKQGDGSDPNHFWMVLNGRDGDTYWVVNTRYGSNSGNVMYNRYGGVALY